MVGDPVPQVLLRRGQGVAAFARPCTRLEGFSMVDTPPNVDDSDEADRKVVES